MRNERLARALLRLYPRAWRERYEDEYVALVEDSRPTTAVVLNIVVGALRQRMRTLVSAESIDPVATSVAWPVFVMMAKSPVLAVCIWWLADALNATGLDTPPHGFWSSFVAAAAIWRVLMPTARVAWEKATWPGLSRREIILWTTAIIASAAVDAWPGPRRLEFWLVVVKLYSVLPILDMSSRRARARQQAISIARRKRRDAWMAKHATRLHLDR